MTDSSHIPPNSTINELDSRAKEVQVSNIVPGTPMRSIEALAGSVSLSDPVLTPVRSLPDDILEEIFSHSLPLTRDARPFVSESPLLLTLVCTQWRRVALAAPRLWATLHIPLVFDDTRGAASKRSTSISYPSYRPFCAKRAAQVATAAFCELHTARNLALDRWLSRSGTLPLSISLHDAWSCHPYSSPPQLTPKAKGHIQATLDLVARYADRMAALEATAPLSVLEDLGRAIARYFSFTSLPLLRRFCVWYERGSYSALIDDPPTVPLPHISMFIAAQSLQQLWLAVHLDEIPPAIWAESPSCTVTDLTLHLPYSAHVAHHILDKLPKLETCHITAHGHMYSGHRHTYTRHPGSNLSLKPIPTISLPALKTLTMCGPLLAIKEFFRPTIEVLAPLRLHLDIKPELYQLVLYPVNGILPYPPSSTSGLVRFLAPSTSLHTLILALSGVTSGEAQSILASLPHLTALVVTDIPTSHDISPHAVPCPLYSLYPLLRQERVSVTRAGEVSEVIQIEAPLLPNLTSFTWTQSLRSQIPIPNDLLVTFLMARLYPPPSRTPVGPVATRLRNIAIRLRQDLKIDAAYIEDQVARYAKSVGLQRGVDFDLDVSVYPPALEVTQGPQ